MGTAVDAGVFPFKLGYLIEPQHFAIHWTVHLHFPLYISHSNTFLPTINHLFLSQYGMKVYEGGKDWTRKYHKSKPLQLVTTNISLFEKSSKLKNFLVQWFCGLIQSVLGTEWYCLALRILFYYLASILSSENWAMILGLEDLVLLFGLHP